MSYHLPALVFLVPFVAAICLPMAALKNARRCRPIALGSVATMAILAVMNLWVVLSQGEIRYTFGGWAPTAGIEWVADEVACLMAVTLSVLALVCLLYGGGVSAAPAGERAVPYYTTELLLISGLAGIVYAADLFNVFVFLEIVALSAYALVGVSGGRALVSAFRYLIMGALGATFYLLGVSYLYAVSGTLNMADLAQRVPEMLASHAVVGGLSFMFIGLGIKMAMMPLHGWLPDAYSDAPDAVSPLLASLLTKVALLAWIRILYWVVGAGHSGNPADVFTLVWIVGALASVAGALLALPQRDLKKMFAYGGLAHVGLVLVGIGQGTRTGLTGGLLYLMNDAVMQCALFILAGIMGSRYGARTLDEIERTTVRSPWLLGTFLIVAISMIGLPPTGGFFGKWYILLSAIETSNHVAIAAVVLTTLLTLAYFARIFQRMFRSGQAAASPAESETPLLLRVSLGVLSAGIIGLGLWSDPVVDVLLQSASRLEPST
jgi:multicomponent Na+:H+ antiporter subunit D